MMLNSLTVIGQMIPPYLYTPVLVVVWLLALWLVKRIVFRRLKKWAERTSLWWDDILIESLSFPANILILVSGLILLTSLLPLSEKADHWKAMVLQGSVIFCAVFFIDSLIQGLMGRHSKKTAIGHLSQGVIQGLVRGFVIGIGVLIFLDLIGISITPILASLGIGSLAVALALQDTLSNFFAGLYMAVDKPVHVGDFIKLESGEEGYIADIGWRNTRLHTLSNNIVIIANSKLIGSVITNYYLPDKELAVPVSVGVHYASDLDLVERVTCEVARQVMKTVTGSVANFEPSIRYHAFGESSIQFSVVMRAKEFTDTYLIKHEFIKRLQQRYQKEGIVMPFPTRTLEISKDTREVLKKEI